MRFKKKSLAPLCQPRPIQIRVLSLPNKRFFVLRKMTTTRKSFKKFLLICFVKKMHESVRIIFFMQQHNLGCEVSIYYQVKFCIKAVTVNIKRLSYLSPSSSISIAWRADSWRRRHAAPQLSALQTMEMALIRLTLKTTDTA